MSDLYGIGTAVSGVVNAVTQYQMNERNLAEQRRINNQMLDYSKNAYSYAAADRLRAGLSPIDTQPSEVPSLTASQGTAPDFSSVGSALDSALQFREQKRVNDATISAANAKASSDFADAQSKEIDNTIRLQNAEVELEKYKADLQNAKDKHSEYAKTIELTINRLSAEIEKMRSENANLQELLRQRVNDANYWNGIGLPAQSSLSISPDKYGSDALLLLGMSAGNTGKAKSNVTGDGYKKSDYNAWRSALSDEWKKARAAGDFDKAAQLAKLSEMSYKQWIDWKRANETDK